MNADKQKALEAAGWKFGDAADFLGMTDDEQQLQRRKEAPTARYCDECEKEVESDHWR